MNKFIAFTRSILFYAFYGVFIAFFGTFICIFGIFLRHSVRQNIATWANVLIVKWLNFSCDIKLVVDGLDNIPNTPCVVLSKHQSGWETFYLQRLLRPVSTILKKELFWIPFLSFLDFKIFLSAINPL